MNEKEEKTSSEIESEDLIKSDDKKNDENVENKKTNNDEIDKNDNSPSENEKELKKEEKLDEIIKELESLKDEKLRLLAEMDNLRKRSAKDKDDWIKYGSINLARDILSPSDNLTRALDAIPMEEKRSDSINNLIDGLKMVQKEFMLILEKHGVKKIEALNNKFDHNFHQAMLEVESDKHDNGTVVQEIQTGFTMHDRLLRPSMVGVSKTTENKKKNKKD
ncbi:MAG: Protein GrpE [Alphaproteobacteria bacterium MarineAlpha5_Bin8]|nr:MAG: Protein GrpE [Alphaproteobacteria bacterium MarineAlpha5_Bin7]PPR48151.1 MAG: Protein GrpE [Alphaproteobacteria bacterium MarineAlpha5_Bin8]PPR54726.1 MAG: Protein GrpE [Alphaproteobacteria bacterium MarineAlpha5_Bin6]|tara:strand:+ start:3161 stop:3820 length:660 start_codon:yes stop_codon:yes gene_type:complete